MSDAVVPALVGLPGSEAVELGVESGVVVVSDDAEDLVTTSAPVVDQDPKAGFGVEPGSTVRVTLGRSGRPPLVPDPVTAPEPGAPHPLDEPDILDVPGDTLARQGEPRDLAT